MLAKTLGIEEKETEQDYCKWLDDIISSVESKVNNPLKFHSDILEKVVSVNFISFEQLKTRIN